MAMNVTLGAIFAERLQRYTKEDRDKILKFMLHVKQLGFDGLEGRNKFSDDIDKNDPKFITKVRFVNKHCLWHYHIGIAFYIEGTKFGDRLSKYVLHYSRLAPDEIKIADMDEHPPFVLPTEKFLT